MGPQLYRCGNLSPVMASDTSLSVLQWGRNFIVAESHVPGAPPPYHGRASMGPQLYRSGNRLRILHSQPFSTSFNGAATLSLRKCLQPQDPRQQSPCFNGAATLSLRKSIVIMLAIGTQVLASMGPQLYRCGNENLDGILTVFRMLQWGRNFIVAEILCARSGYIFASGRFNGAATLSLRKSPASRPRD